MVESLPSRLHRILMWSTAVAGLAGLPAEAAAQQGPDQPRGRLGAWMAEARASPFGVWIEEGRSSPFHDLMVSGALANPAAESAVGEGVGFPDMIRPPMSPLPELPDSAVSRGKVFGYTLVAAFVPMVPAMTKSGSTSMGDLVWFFGGWAVTLVSVPVAAMAAGTTSVPETIVGAALGFVAGAVLGGAFAVGFGDYWYSPTYAVTMSIVTTAIAPR